MKIQFQTRAAVAMQFLDADEKRHVFRATQMLEARKPSDSIRLVKSPISSGVPLYIYRAGPRTRLIVSFVDDTCMIEDVLDIEKLNHFMPRVQGGRK